MSRKMIGRPFVTSAAAPTDRHRSGGGDGAVRALTKGDWLRSAAKYLSPFVRDSYTAGSVGSR